MSFRNKFSYNTRLMVITIAAVVSLLPVLFVFANSLMSSLEAEARYSSIVTAHNSFGVIDGNMHYMDITLVPDVLSASAWREILLENPANLRYLWNSIVLAVTIVAGQLIIAPLAAYGLERARTRHKEKLYFAYIIIMLLPLQALLVPHFIAANILGISGGYLAIILPAIVAPLGVFLIRQQMKGFEKSIIEAAAIDGAGEFTIFCKMILPNIMPAMAALTVLAFAEAWNIVDQAVVFIRNRHDMPLSVHLSTNLTDNIGVVFALSTLFMIPALIIFIGGQDDLGEGLIYSGGK
ncbi:MAG: carbohydrate ABC transporter permease [Oscillospiraceae bacterium]|nr:carbohydrate ABC transporter permease [Oscillospiraceae bacterium]